LSIWCGRQGDFLSHLIAGRIPAQSWIEDLIQGEETSGAIEVIEGKPWEQAKGRDTQPITMALIEAKLPATLVRIFTQMRPIL